VIAPSSIIASTIAVAPLQVDRVFGQVGVAHDHVEAPVLLAIRVRLVARVDDRPLHHRIERDLGLEEVGALRDLVLARVPAVLRPHLARAAVHLPRHEERHQALDDLLEGRAAVHQVILVRSVAVAFPVAVVLVDQHLRAGR
jgi:hypothetical protein